MFIDIEIIDNNISVSHTYVLNEVDLSKERVFIIVYYFYTFVIVIAFTLEIVYFSHFKILHIEMKTIT